jgi:hypothetical protein
MFDEMTTSDLIIHANQHDCDNCDLISELATRLSRLNVWRERMIRVLGEHLTEDDGSDLIPDHIRVSNMLGRISSSNK